MKRSLAVVAFAILASAAALPAAAGTRIYVRIGPPAAIVETRVARPGPRHIWIAGYHRWDGHAYVWVSGRWVLPPAGRRAWVAGHWVHHRRSGWYWVEGHWR